MANQRRLTPSSQNDEKSLSLIYAFRHGRGAKGQLKLFPSSGDAFSIDFLSNSAVSPLSGFSRSFLGSRIFFSPRGILVRKLVQREMFLYALIYSYFGLVRRNIVHFGCTPT